MSEPRYPTSCVERFLDYVTYDTQSVENSETFPSTLKQLDCESTMCRIEVTQGDLAANTRLHTEITKVLSFNSRGFSYPVEIDEDNRQVTYVMIFSDETSPHS